MTALSRREFLTRLGGASATLPLDLIRARRAGAVIPALLSSPSPKGQRVVLVDPGGRCVLRESVAGFAQGLAAAGVAHELFQAGAIRLSKLLLVPGATLGSLAFTEELCACAERGTTVLYESGAAYAAPQAFATEQRLLARCFGVDVRPPVHLGTETSEAAGEPRCTPYIVYAWPTRLHVRDFSRIIPVVAPTSCAMATYGETPVACRREVGRGAFIFLGSPLGPHLLANDREAHAWLRALVAA
ncbi:MAG TPA: hypothetical protein VL523_05810 [Terriglobia bacterium]|nr:hypothetical protein [Terriglobia bacterium]